jgi:hypothetical protein
VPSANCVSERSFHSFFSALSLLDIRVRIPMTRARPTLRLEDFFDTVCGVAESFCAPWLTLYSAEEFVICT